MLQRDLHQLKIEMTKYYCAISSSPHIFMSSAYSTDPRNSREQLLSTLNTLVCQLRLTSYCAINCANSTSHVSNKIKPYMVRSKTQHRIACVSYSYPTFNNLTSLIFENVSSIFSILYCCDFKRWFTVFRLPTHM